MTDLTHCGVCGRKLRRKEFIWASNMPPAERWLGHAAGRCGDNYGPTATAQQIKDAMERREQ